MFDLRYHVASLAAVFLALVLGIVIGAAISDPGLADRTSKQALRDRIDRLNRQLDDAEARAEQGGAAESFAKEAYQALMHERLSERRVLLVSVGPVDDQAGEATAAVRDAGGTVARMRALQLPARLDPIETELRTRPALRGYVGADQLRDVGRDLARELVDGGETPLLDALAGVLVQERERRRDDGRPVDGVVVVRSAPPQTGVLAGFVTGLYEGLAGASRSVGVEFSSSRPSTIRVFDRAGLSTVDSIDTVPGKVALVVLLAGGRPGHYGLKETARDGIAPPIEPLAPEPAR